jgi:hypothetical protein
MKPTQLQQKRLLAVCDAILENDTEETVTGIIVWPDASKPGGASTLLFDEENNEVSIFMAADETEARKMHALLNAAGPGPLKAVAQ